jgi:hypothetical protein
MNGRPTRAGFDSGMRYQIPRSTLRSPESDSETRL